MNIYKIFDENVMKKMVMNISTIIIIIEISTIILSLIIPSFNQSIILNEYCNRQQRYTKRISNIQYRTRNIHFLFIFTNQSSIKMITRFI